MWAATASRQPPSQHGQEQARRLGQSAMEFLHQSLVPARSDISLQVALPLPLTSMTRSVSCDRTERSNMSVGAALSDHSPPPQMAMYIQFQNHASGHLHPHVVEVPSSLDDPIPLFTSTKNLLHRVCFHGLGADRVERVLMMDPAAANRGETVRYRAATFTWCFKEKKMVQRTNVFKAPYRYPLHLFIKSMVRKAKAGSDDRRLAEADCLRILQHLILSGPKILLSSDGSAQASSLAILIKEMSVECSQNSGLLRGCLSIVDRMVAMDPSIALRKDRQGNTPLHYAVQHGAPLDLVRGLHDLNPTAVGTMNHHGATPLDAARRRTGNMREQDEIVDFLQDRFDKLHFGDRARLIS